MEVLSFFLDSRFKWEDSKPELEILLFVVLLEKGVHYK